MKRQTVYETIGINGCIIFAIISFLCRLSFDMLYKLCFKTSELIVGSYISLISHRLMIISPAPFHFPPV